MNRNMRMMMLNSRRTGGYDKYGGGYEDNYGGEDRYEMENRFRDRRGREHYDNGRYAPMRNEYRDDYRNEYRDDYRNEYDGGYENRTRNTIGFNRGGYDESRNDMRLVYGAKGGKGGKDMEYGGGAAFDGFGEEEAEEWVRSMKGADGGSGEHWTMAQVKQLIAQRKLKLDPIDLYIALNATYSDLSKFFKKYNINNMDAYIDYAKMFWLEDEDAVEDKLAAYYMYVVK